MTSTVTLGGPGLIALVVLAVLIWAVSAYVAIDALRRYRTDYAGVPEGRWFYAVPQIVFFVAFLAWQVPYVQQRISWIGDLLIIIPFILAQQMAYLLRVVFPTAKRLEKRLEAERAAGLRGPAEDEEGAVEFDALEFEPPDDVDGDFFDDSDDRSSTHA
jgi:ABC-type multidrug transport system fused ATPase/permease subunit